MKFWQRYWAIIRPFKREIMQTVFWIACSTLMDLAGPYMNKLVFDLINVWAMPQKGMSSSVIEWLLPFMPAVHTLAWLALTILLARLVLEFASSGIGLFQQRAWLRMNLLMTREMPSLTLSHLLKLSIGHHIRERTSRQITKIDRGVHAVGRITDGVFGRFLSEGLTLPVTLIALFMLDVHVGILTMLMAAATALWARHDYHHLKPHRERMERLYQDASTVSNEALSNVATVQAFGREAHERGRIEAAHQNIFEVEWTQGSAVMRSGYLRDGLGRITAILVIVVGLWKMDQGVMSLGTLVMLLQLSDRLVSSSRQLIREWMDLGRLSESLVPLLDLLDTPADVVSLPTALPVTDLQGRLQFDHVEFAYNGEGTSLQDVSFTVEPGQMLAIVGPSGSGKSTIVSLLLRAYDPKSGAILIDGKDLRVLQLEEYRAQLGIVPQQVEIFSISIRDNIAYGRPQATHDEIMSAATLAGAHDFILHKPNGYDTLVGERGLDLSGGERQRIGIARAVLRNPRVLIFDEATASLDALSEQRIQEALEILRQDRTTIVIAHRFSTIKRADSIVVVDAGRVVAQGTRAQLREGNPLFAELELLQATDAIRA